MALLNGFGGCAMIGQTVINLSSGGRGRLSGVVAGVMILLFILFLSPLIERIPLAALVVACIVGLNQAALLERPWRAGAAVILHNGLGLGAGWLAARTLGCSRTDARTIALEVGMQNSGLGAALATQYFGAASALPSAIFSLWHNVSGVALARRWAKRR